MTKSRISVRIWIPAAPALRERKRLASIWQKFLKRIAAANVRTLNRLKKTPAHSSAGYTLRLPSFFWQSRFTLWHRLFRVDRFFPELTGHNVTAVKKCTGEVKRRIFFNGHPDAAWEWPVNYALGGIGFEGHAVICALGAVYYMVISIIYMAQNGISFGVLVPFLVGLYWMWNKNRIVDGANDNLSGCYMGIAILKALKDNGIELENTEVGVILTGSEEAGLRGAKAW